MPTAQQVEEGWSEYDVLRWLKGVPRLKPEVLDAFEAQEVDGDALVGLMQFPELMGVPPLLLKAGSIGKLSKAWAALVGLAAAGGGVAVVAATPVGGGSSQADDELADAMWQL